MQTVLGVSDSLEDTVRRSVAQSKRRNNDINKDENKRRNTTNRRSLDEKSERNHQPSRIQQSTVQNPIRSTTNTHVAAKISDVRANPHPKPSSDATDSTETADSHSVQKSNEVNKATNKNKDISWDSVFDGVLPPGL